ncbi:MAG: hypothetical protein OXI87_20805 [Albidovulum sp.]|nr:hypothetical protein [Albidovulum sp.]
MNVLIAEGMTRSAKRTVEKPGGNVNTVSGLSSAIFETGWRGPRRTLACKGHALVDAEPSRTRQNCNSFGHVNPESWTGRKINCLTFSRADHVDLNAACNIIAFGMGATARRTGFASTIRATRETIASATKEGTPSE